MTDDQWIRLWRKWCALSDRARARYLRMAQHLAERKALPF